MSNRNGNLYKRAATFMRFSTRDNTPTGGDLFTLRRDLRHEARETVRDWRHAHGLPYAQIVAQEYIVTMSQVTHIVGWNGGALAFYQNLDTYDYLIFRGLAITTVVNLQILLTGTLAGRPRAPFAGTILIVHNGGNQNQVASYDSNTFINAVTAALAAGVVP